MTDNSVLTDEVRADLKAFAEAATQGLWKAEGTIYEHMAAEVRCVTPGDERGIAQVWQHAKGFADARFIAAANPATVLSLLAALEEAEGRAGRLEAGMRIIAEGTVSSAPEGHYLAHRAAVKVARAALSPSNREADQ